MARLGVLGMIGDSFMTATPGVVSPEGVLSTLVTRNGVQSYQVYGQMSQAQIQQMGLNVSCPPACDPTTGLPPPSVPGNMMTGPMVTSTTCVPPGQIQCGARLSDAQVQQAISLLSASGGSASRSSMTIPLMIGAGLLVLLLALR